MSTKEPWFLSERAEMLAMVTFTRLPGISVQRQAENDFGVDFLVSVSAKRGGRVFGVEVKGGTKLDAYLTKELHVRENVAQFLDKHAGDSPFPIGLAVFDMSDDSGYFGWYLAPSNSSPGALERRETIEVVRLSDEKLQEIVDQVEFWYDSRANLVSSRSA